MSSMLDSYMTAAGTQNLDSEDFAAFMDKQELSLPHLREQFAYPTHTSLSKQSTTVPNSELSEPIYFCGNSLGLMPKEVRRLVDEELDIWAGRGVLGHFDHPLQRPWKDITDTVQASMARVVGGKEAEVAVMGTLTANLHTLLSSFYKPTDGRTKILYEAKAFPSDEYAFTSQVRLHDLNPKEHLVAMKPRQGEYTLRAEDILSTIEEHKQEIAVVMFSGVQYYTGQFFDIEKITRKGHEIGAIVGWDLAHAVGNVPLQLHDWGVDFACWCNYKYMNAGPGAIAGIFVHESAKTPRTIDDGFNYPNRLSGWWGHDAKTRFLMEPTFDPMSGAAGYQLSNPSVLNTVSLLASLNIFDTTSIRALREKSVLLTRYLEHLLDRPVEGHPQASYKIITPRDPTARGAQLSVLFEPAGQGVMEFIMEHLLGQGIIGDERRPDVIRLSPIPSYNTFDEVRRVAQAVRQAVLRWKKTQSGDDGQMMQTT